MDLIAYLQYFNDVLLIVAESTAMINIMNLFRYISNYFVDKINSVSPKGIDRPDLTISIAAERLSMQPHCDKISLPSSPQCAHPKYVHNRWAVAVMRRVMLLADHPMQAATTLMVAKEMLVQIAQLFIYWQWLHGG